MSLSCCSVFSGSGSVIDPVAIVNFRIFTVLTQTNSKHSEVNRLL